MAVSVSLTNGGACPRAEARKGFFFKTGLGLVFFARNRPRGTIGC